MLLYSSSTLNNDRHTWHCICMAYNICTFMTIYVGKKNYTINYFIVRIIINRILWQTSQLHKILLNQSFGLVFSHQTLCSLTKLLLFSTKNVTFICKTEIQFFPPTSYYFQHKGFASECTVSRATQQFCYRKHSFTLF